MTANPFAHDRAQLRRDLFRTLAIVAIALSLMAVATALVGWNVAVPKFDITVDPAGSMPF